MINGAFAIIITKMSSKSFKTFPCNADKEYVYVERLETSKFETLNDLSIAVSCLSASIYCIAADFL